MSNVFNDQLADLRKTVTSRASRKFHVPVNNLGNAKKVSEYYGELTFDFKTSPDITEVTKKEIRDALENNRGIKKDHAEMIAKAVMDWAVSHGATHFCHWFQPLTGTTAEKHDAFFTLKNSRPIERLSAGQLLQGEPDASSFPNGGSRSTFEARGYTTWDLTSPMFLIESTNGKTLCIPTAFVSYNGESLDIKTPLLKSISKLSPVVTKFLNLAGHPESKSVIVTCGAEQEYFLIDKAFYYSRPDLVMTGRTLFGALSTRNQQLEDHYFGTIPDRILAFMQELDYDLHRLGIPSKTRHNEVAPGQYEMAPIFTEANVASDNNQIIMTTIKKVAEKHDLVAILHEKPFAGVNGSGKHVNWSLSDNNGLNLLEPGNEPQSNLRFLATVAITVEALCRHAKAIRMSISGAGNDHRLGANEAPPSIMSAYLGDTLEKIFTAIIEDKSFTPRENNVMDLGTSQLAHLLQDNTDRNRTSPFAFTGNKFEFRAVGSSQAIGFPLTILNAAVTDVFIDANNFLEESQKNGMSVNESLLALIKKFYNNSKHVVFNGDGYSQKWVEEAQRRGLPNLRTTPEALDTMREMKDYEFLIKGGIYKKEEIETRYNVLLERYIKLREIELDTLVDLVHQFVIPSAISYKMALTKVLKGQRMFEIPGVFEMAVYKRLTTKVDELHMLTNKIVEALTADHHDHHQFAIKIANELMPTAAAIALACNELEELIPHNCYMLPKYYDMLFLK